MIRVDQVSDEQARRFLHSLEAHEDAWLCIHGHLNVVCREEDEVVWTVDQDNLLTDYGRRWWIYDGFRGTTMGIFTSPSTDIPDVGRCSLFDVSGMTQIQTATLPTNDSNSLSKSWATTFGLPASNRTIGTVGINTNMFSIPNIGALGIICYSLLTPVKVQTTSQTLEISYRLTLQPGV